MEAHPGDTEGNPVVVEPHSYDIDLNPGIDQAYRGVTQARYRDIEIDEAHCMLVEATKEPYRLVRSRKA